LSAHFDADQLETILPHATEREAEAIRAVLAEGSGPKAAAATGLSLEALQSRIRCARNRWRRNQVGAAAPPEGFVPTHIATDSEGRIRSVRSRAELPEQHFPTVPAGHSVKGISTYLNAAGEPAGQWVKTDRQQQERWQAFREAMRSEAALVPALPLCPAPKACDEDLATWLPWGDPHIGLLAWHNETGESWDLKLVEQHTAQVMADLISRTPRSGQFILADLGDLFDAEDDKQSTPTAGHKLDVDCRAGKIARVAVRICRNAIDLALQRHGRVLVHLLRGNHDPYKSIMLGMWLEATYANEPRVTIAPYDNPYQFWQFGQNAVMLHHGDGSKPQQMGEIFACDPSWGPAKHRYVYTGHIHSQNRWDLRGCSVESFRTIAAQNYWAHHKGYRSKRTLDCITLHRELGEISRVQQGLRSA
jgi:hypothetical protein